MAMRAIRRTLPHRFSLLSELRNVQISLDPWRECAIRICMPKNKRVGLFQSVLLKICQFGDMEEKVKGKGLSYISHMTRRDVGGRTSSQVWKCQRFGVAGAGG